MAFIYTNEKGEKVMGNDCPLNGEESGQRTVFHHDGSSDYYDRNGKLIEHRPAPEKTELQKLIEKAQSTKVTIKEISISEMIALLQERMSKTGNVNRNKDLYSQLKEYINSDDADKIKQLGDDIKSIVCEVFKKLLKNTELVDVYNIDVNKEFQVDLRELENLGDDELPSYIDIWFHKRNTDDDEEKGFYSIPIKYFKYTDEDWKKFRVKEKEERLAYLRTRLSDVTEEIKDKEKLAENYRVTIKKLEADLKCMQ